MELIGHGRGKGFNGKIAKQETTGAWMRCITQSSSFAVGFDIAPFVVFPLLCADGGAGLSVGGV